MDPSTRIDGFFRSGWFEVMFGIIPSVASTTLCSSFTRGEGLEHFVVGGTRSDEEVRRRQSKRARQA